ncbi:hypothetical protein ACHAXA_005769 [Cyclostephanos tholiformis]|uniref:NTF2 domain-containing protein n=1 Tax=Cyclostephanos tholiformis TaxID=382380 RepID=A0ABD3RUE3_9STRA
MTMEDRHTISEPRPVEKNANDGFSWEVDILRDDTVIVDTFLLNSDVLPPRINKKGKVVWKLPDRGDKLPSFGSEDRRRILDIFRERKKKRKQEKKKMSFSSCQDEGPENGESECFDSSSAYPEKKGGVCGHDGKEDDESNGDRDFVGNGNGQQQDQNNTLPECGRRAVVDTFKEPQHTYQPLPSILPPPGLSAPLRSTCHEAGPHQSQQLYNHLHSRVPNAPDLSGMNLNDSMEISPPSRPKLADVGPSMSSQILSIELPQSDSLFITVPRYERPERIHGQPESSLAVPAARHFIAKYYSHFDGTTPGAQLGDLFRYYTLKAQKSVSIGGAHSVVTGRGDIAAQISSLAGTAFVVRGVVAQDTADGKGVHILVTGTAITSLSGSPGGVVANFAHSISLVSVGDEILRGINGDAGRKRDSICPALLVALEFGFPFQIHNDALALLSGDAGAVTPNPIPQPTQQQQPQQPPGLF